METARGAWTFHYETTTGEPMTATDMPPQTARKYEVEVREEGRVELTVPFAPGTRVVVFVIGDEDDPTADLLDAAHSSTGFWDNPFDDEDWNGA
jgi:hypothetical protein